MVVVVVRVDGRAQVERKRMLASALARTGYVMPACFLFTRKRYCTSGLGWGWDVKDV